MVRRRPGGLPRRARRARGQGGGEVDVERVYRHLPTTLPIPHGAITGDRAHVGFAACAMRVVAVDVDLGLTECDRRAQDRQGVNPLSVEARSNGVAGLGLRWRNPDRDGKITRDFTDYLIGPRSTCRSRDGVIEVPEFDAPYGEGHRRAAVSARHARRVGARDAPAGADASWPTGRHAP
jgi:hypothetical protein